MRIAFVDVEASGLMAGSFPIEIAWVDQASRGESHLIRPAPGWEVWSRSAERIPGITRKELRRDGLPHEEVARRLVGALRSAALYVDAPDCDGPWIGMLLNAAHFNASLKIRPVSEACRSALHAMDGLLTGPVKSPERERQLQLALTRSRRILNASVAHAKKVAPRTHRAMDDAMHLCTIWHEINRRVAKELARSPG